MTVSSEQSSVGAFSPSHSFHCDQLPTGRADSAHVASALRIIDRDTGKIETELRLPNGSTSVAGLKVTPDGGHAVLIHLVGHIEPSTESLKQRWMCGNAVTLVDVAGLEIVGTVLLDDRNRGAANPSACGFTADGRKLLITHAGTHEVSIIDFPDLVEKMMALPAPLSVPPSALYSVGSPEEIAYATALKFFPAKRQRLKLPEGDLGPRGLSIIGDKAYVTNYFSDTVSIVDLSHDPATASSVRLAPEKPWTEERKGELYFHDARICYQGWQSCTSCHPDARVDGLNWDLLNDGRGNHKNTKSMLYAHRTSPAMSLGVRETAEMAVRSGIKNILNTDQPESVAKAIDAYLKSLKPAPSPHLTDGKLGPLAQKGVEVFQRAKCADCHPPDDLFTDRKPHQVGTHNRFDKPEDRFDTPTLIEVWRTPPYLHDGSAETIREVLTKRNPHDQHGRTQNLSADDIDALCAYVLSL